MFSQFIGNQNSSSCIFQHLCSIRQTYRMRSFSVLTFYVLIIGPKLLKNRNIWLKWAEATIRGALYKCSKLYYLCIGFLLEVILCSFIEFALKHTCCVVFIIKVKGCCRTVFGTVFCLGKLQESPLFWKHWTVFSNLRVQLLIAVNSSVKWNIRPFTTFNEYLQQQWCSNLTLF